MGGYVHNGKVPLVVAQHSKTIAGDHRPNRDGDAIVMGCEALPKQRQAPLAGGSRVAAHAVRSKCPVALPDAPWVALLQADQQAWETMIGESP
jgi:hypothetical protein